MKPFSILAYLVLSVLIVWSLVRYSQNPKDNTPSSYEYMNTMQAKYNSLMPIITRGLNEPDKTERRSRPNGYISLRNYYVRPNAELISTVEKNIASQTYWEKIQPRKIDDSTIFKSYCYNEISLDLSLYYIDLSKKIEQLMVSLTWDKNSYCQQKMNDDI